MTTTVYPGRVERPVVPTVHRLPLTVAIAAAVTLLFSVFMITYRGPSSDSIVPAALTEQAISPEEQNLEIFTRFVEEVWNQGDFSVLPELVTDDYTYRETNDDTEYVGAAAFGEYIRNVHTLVPNFHLSVERTTQTEDAIWALLQINIETVIFEPGPDENSDILPFTLTDLAPTTGTMVVDFRQERIAAAWMDINIGPLVWAMAPNLMEGAATADDEISVEAQNIALARKALSDHEALAHSANTDQTLADLEALYDPTIALWLNDDLISFEQDAYGQFIHTVYADLKDVDLTITNIAADGATHVLVRYNGQGVMTSADGQENVITWRGTITYRVQLGRIMAEWWHGDAVFHDLFGEKIAAAAAELAG